MNPGIVWQLLSVYAVYGLVCSALAIGAAGLLHIFASGDRA
jgi:hypothetical protein